MFVLGWAVLHILSLFTRLEQIKRSQAKTIRTVLLVVGCILVAIPIPYIIWHGVSFYRMIDTSSVLMPFPYIPIYHEMMQGIIYLTVYAPFAYSILGGLFWLFGLPSTSKASDILPIKTEE